MYPALKWIEFLLSMQSAIGDRAFGDGPGDSARTGVTPAYLILKIPLIPQQESEAG